MDFDTPELKDKKFEIGRWSDDEHERFMMGDY